MSVQDTGNLEVSPLLFALADPALPTPERETVERCGRYLLDHIEKSGIEAIAFRKLEPLGGGNDKILDIWLEKARARQFKANIQSMLLMAECDRITKVLVDAGMQFEVVKGPSFAKHLYDELSDRPFTDIDFLISPDDFNAIFPLMEKSNYRFVEHSCNERASSHLEQKWELTSNPSMLVEIHADLVHYPLLRRIISFGLAEFRKCSAVDRFPMAAQFMTAVIHASCSHKFHNLRFLTDLLQALRHLEPEDLAHLCDVADELGAWPEILACLDLVSQVFNSKDISPRAEFLAAKAPLRMSAWPVNARTIIEAPDRTWRSRASRAFFRFRQHIARRHSLEV